MSRRKINLQEQTEGTERFASRGGGGIAPETETEQQRAGSESRAPKPETQNPEPAPVSPERPLEWMHLCNIAGHDWKRKTTPGGQWTYAECANPTCGKIVEIKKVGRVAPRAPQPETQNPKPETL